MKPASPHASRITHHELMLSNRATPLEYGGGELPTRIHIVPRGELFNKEAGITQVLDDKAIDSILADLKNKSTAGGLYMGEEHFIYDASRSSEAFAWGKQFGADAQGIWVESPEYTDIGGTAIKNKRFKWTSFVADPAQAGAVEKVSPGKFRILKIDTVGFTNFANGKAMLQPISNRNTFPGSDESADTKETNDKTKMKNLLLAMGLSAEASEDSAITAFNQFKNRADRADVLETEVCEAVLDGCGLKAEDKRRAHLVTTLKPLKNRAERLTHLADFGIVPVQAGKPAAGVRILNRAEGKPAEVAATEGDEQATTEKAAKIKNRANQLVAGGMKFEQAWNMARNETDAK